MPRPSPLALRIGERATAKPRRDRTRPRGGPHPATIPIRPTPLPLCAARYEVPDGAHSFRMRVFEAGIAGAIPAHPARNVFAADGFTVVVDYLTEEQARHDLVPDLRSDSSPGVLRL